MSNPARGMYQQLRAHDRAIEKASLRVHERVVEQSKANAALARLNPHDGLHAAGHACAVHTSDELHASCERGATLLRWCGRDDTLIDRHDARALLDTVREAPPWQPGPRPGPRLSDDAAREERLAQFERYKDLVRLLKRGLGGAEQPRGLALVESEALQRRVAAVGHTAPTAREMRVPAAAAGAAPALARGGSDDDDDDGSEDSEDEAAAALAAACGIADYGWHVRDEKRRAAEAAGAGPAAPHITKRDRKRARRRILEAERNGQAPPADAVALLKEAAEAAQQVPAERGRPSERGHSPSYAPYRRRSASRSASPRRRSGAAAVPEPAPVKEFISEFAMPASAVARAHDSDGDDALLFSDAPDTRPPAAAAAPARRPAVTPAVAPARKETPAERLKRLMSAQLNQQIAKDAAAEAAKLHAVARERAVIARRDDAARDAGIRPAPALPPRHPQPEAHRARRESRDDASRSSSRSRSRSRRSRSHSRGRRRRSRSSSSDSRRHRRRSCSRRRRHRRSRSRSRSRSRRRSRSTSRSGRRRESRRSESRSRSRRRSR